MTENEKCICIYDFFNIILIITLIIMHLNKASLYLFCNESFLYAAKYFIINNHFASVLMIILAWKALLVVWKITHGEYTFSKERRFYISWKSLANCYNVDIFVISWILPLVFSYNWGIIGKCLCIFTFLGVRFYLISLKVRMIVEKIVCNIPNKPFINAALITGAILGITLFYKCIRWEGADDFTISQLLLGTPRENTPYTLVCSYFLGIIVIFLQKTFPVINWFTGLEIISVLISFSIYNWFILKNINWKRKIRISYPIIFSIIFQPMFLLNLQYTRSSFLLSFAGALLFYDACIGELFVSGRHKESAKCCIGKIGEIALGTLLFVLGSLFRYKCFYVVIAYIMILVAGYGLSAWKKHNGISKSNLFRRIEYLGVCIIASVAISFCLYKVNLLFYNNWGEIRSSVIDYLPSEYPIYFEESSFMISYNDWDMMKKYEINDSFFNEGYFESVLDVMSNHNKYDTEPTSKDVNYNIEQIVKIRQGRGSQKYTQFYIMLAIGITSLFVFKIKDYTRVVALINIMGTGILIWYFLSGSRFPAWVSGPIYLFASFVFILYAGCVKDDSLQYEKKAIVRLLKQIRENIFLICLLICMSINNQIFNSIAEVNYYNPDLKDAIEYCEKTDEVILLDNISNAPYPYIDTRGALYAYQEGQWDNIIRVGNWDVGHPEREKQKETLGIDSVIYSMAEGKSKLLSQEGSASFNRYTIFFKEHYGLDVYFELERSFGNYGIYRCVCN